MKPLALADEQERVRALARMKRFPLLFILAGMAIAVLLAVGYIGVVLQPPAQDVQLLVLFMTGSGLLTVVLAYVLYRRGLVRWLPSLRWTLLTIVLIMGAAMYVLEGEQSGFTSIPRSVYWAIVTLTTVGYGDITPGTILGQALSSVVMIMGYGIIAVPTGIFAAELRGVMISHREVVKCRECGRTGHDEDAKFCKYCGANFTEPTEDATS